MLGHDRIPDHDETAAQPDLLQNFEKQVPSTDCSKERPLVEAARGDEVQMSGAVVAMQAWRHWKKKM